MKGKLKFFNRTKRFGFITGEDEKEYFVHLSQVDNQRFLFENDEVEFTAAENDRGLAAENVKILKKASEDGEEDSSYGETAAPAEEEKVEETSEAPAEEEKAEEAPAEEAESTEE